MWKTIIKKLVEKMWKTINIVNIYVIIGNIIQILIKIEIQLINFPLFCFLMLKTYDDCLIIPINKGFYNSY